MDDPRSSMVKIARATSSPEQVRIMAQQTVHATKKASASASRAERDAREQDDRLHAARLRDARTACRRARSLSARAERFLSSLES